MAQTKDAVIRGFVMGVLVAHTGTPLLSDNIGSIAESIVKAVIEGIEYMNKKECEENKDAN